MGNKIIYIFNFNVNYNITDMYIIYIIFKYYTNTTNTGLTFLIWRKRELKEKGKVQFWLKPAMPVKNRYNVISNNMYLG